MPVDEGDDERWAELPGGVGSDEEEGNSSGDSDEEGANVDNICSLSADDGAAGTLLYPLPALSSVCRTLSISHDSTQGLAARVWPSAAMLVEFIAAEVEREKEREKEKEKEREAGGGCGGDCNDDDGEDTSSGKKAFSWKGASVLELGSGPGLTGIAVAALAGSRVLLTDLEGPALTLARRNVEGNAAEIEEGGGSVAAAALPWGERGAARRAAEEAAVSSNTASSFAAPNAVIAADVIYDGALFSPLLETLEELAFGETSESGGGGGGDDGSGENDASGSSSSSPFRPPRILIAHVRRWKRDARFWAAAKKRFEVFDVTPGRRKSEKAGEEAEGAEGSEGEGEALHHRYSSHEKGALRVFELVPKKKIK